MENISLVIENLCYNKTYRIRKYRVIRTKNGYLLYDGLVYLGISNNIHTIVDKIKELKEV